MAAIWRMLFDYGRDNAFDKTAELVVYNVDFAQGPLATITQSTFNPLLFYDQFNHIGNHVMSYAKYWSFLLDNTMKINNLRYSAFAANAPTIPLLEGSVSINENIVGLQGPRDSFPRLVGNFLQVQWKYVWRNEDPADDFIETPKMIRGKDTIFGCNNIGDNLAIRAGQGDVVSASLPRFPPTADVVPRDYNLGDMLGFLQSCNPISFSRKITPPKWAISFDANVVGTLYHGRSIKHQLSKGY